MRYYHFPETGSIDHLTPGEKPIPQPARGQVLVRMRAASLNYRDLMIAKNQYGSSGLPKDLIPLSDGAGEVVEVGPDVHRVKIGDRVAGIFMQAWIGGELGSGESATALGGAVDGVLTEYRLFEQDGLVHLPAHLSFEEGATLPCAAVTAWNALYGPQSLQAGQAVLVLGTGGVSIFALQLAYAGGARVIATSSSDKKLQRARELGASDGINYKTHPDWEKEVRRLTDGRGVDHVIEVGGTGTLARSIASTRRGGNVYLIGVLSDGAFDPISLMRGGVTTRGIFVGSRQHFEAMNRAIEMHEIHPVIDSVFPFEQAEEAYLHLESASHIGKIVIKMD